MKRLVAEGAKPCPFCGCKKMFVKAFLSGCYSEKRCNVSIQCSKCHVNGPQVFSEWMRVGIHDPSPSFDNLSPEEQRGLILQALLLWNNRPCEETK